MEPFKLERYFSLYEFKVKYLLSASDCEALSMAELLEWSDEPSRVLWQDLTMGYTESQGHPLLREEISRQYTNISPDNLLVAVPEEAIFITMQTLLKPGDHVIALFPAYQSLYEVANSIGCEVTFWEMQPGEMGWQLDLAQLERRLQSNTRLLVINFPHNPTGFLPSRDEFDAILNFARANNLIVFSDEMYRLLELDEYSRLPAVADSYEKGISLSGLSKNMALPGLRIGWLAAQDQPLIEELMQYKNYTTICSSAPSEVLGIMALRNQEQILRRNLKIIRGNLAAFHNFMEQHPAHFSWLPPTAGSIGFPKWTGPVSVDQFCQEVLDQQSVMIVPGSIFDYPGSHFRVGLGRKNLPEALERVGRYLE